MATSCDTLRRKIHLTGASAYLPSAGPACFLDPELAIYNDRDTTIFPSWEQVADEVREAVPASTCCASAPATRCWSTSEERAITAERSPDSRLDEDLDAYRERRRDEWEAYHAGPEPEISKAELDEYFDTLQHRNKRFLGDFTRRTSGSSPAARTGTSDSASSPRTS